MQVLDRLFYKKNEGAPFITTHPLLILSRISFDEEDLRFFCYYGARTQSDG